MRRIPENTLHCQSRAQSAEKKRRTCSFRRTPRQNRRRSRCRETCLVSSENRRVVVAQQRHEQPFAVAPRLQESSSSSKSKFLPFRARNFRTFAPSEDFSPILPPFRTLLTHSIPGISRRFSEVFRRIEAKQGTSPRPPICTKTSLGPLALTRVALFIR